MNDDGAYCSRLSPIPQIPGTTKHVKSLEKSLIVNSFYEYPILPPDPSKTISCLDATKVSAGSLVCLRNQNKSPSWDQVLTSCHNPYLCNQRTTELKSHSVIFSQKSDAEASNGNCKFCNVDANRRVGGGTFHFLS